MCFAFVSSITVFYILFIFVIECVSFGLDVVREDMNTLFTMNFDIIKIYENVNIFIHLFCLFVVSSILYE